MSMEAPINLRIYMIKISPQAYFEPSRGGSRPTEWNIQGRSTVNKPTVMPGLKWEQMGSARFEGSVRSPTIAGAATCLPLSCQMSSVRIAIAKWTVVVMVAAGGLLNGMTEFSMALSPEEMAKRERFAQTYARSQCPPMLAIERRVCGCDYGGNSLTTRSEANQIAERLGLRAGIRLLEVGAGAGWPGLYFSKITGCETMLVDLPLSGLRVATERAAKDRLSSRCWVSVADGSRIEQVCPRPLRLDDTVFDDERIGILFVHRPAVEVLAVEQRAKAVVRNGRRGRRGDQGRAHKHRF